MLERRRGAIGLSVLLVFLGGLGPSWAQGSADSDARQRVRELEEENESLSKKNVQLSSRIVETERAYEELKGRLKEVQSQAVTLAEQMSDASLAKRDMEERLDAMTKSHRGIEEENRRIRRELESLTEELKRKEVALDALSRLANKDSGEEAQSVALTRLRHELDEARRAARVAQSDRLGLVKQVEALTRAMPEGEAERVLAEFERGKLGLYEDDGAGLWAEVVGFARLRFGRMFRNQASWDTTDIVLASVAGVVFLGGVWFAFAPLRWRKRRRLRARIAELEERLRDADQRGLAASRARRQRGNSSSRSSVVRRAAPFSPILSADPADANADHADDAFDESSVGVTQLMPQLAGAPRYDGDDDAAEDENGQTQVISAFGSLDLSGISPSGGAIGSRPSSPSGARPAVPSRPATPTRPSSPQRPAAPMADDDDDEFSNTQIIPSISALEALGGGSSEKPVGELSSGSSSKRRDSGRELLDELEELIGKKVDEIIQ